MGGVDGVLFITIIAQGCGPQRENENGIVCAEKRRRNRRKGGVCSGQTSKGRHSFSNHPSR